MTRADHLRAIREREMEGVLGLFPSGARVLEVGAGAGYQARYLADRGFSVEALDLESSEYLPSSVYPTRLYRGDEIPFADGSFDVVFSSSVLEHVQRLEPFLRETRRVLRNDGLAVHVLPTPGWRFWTSTTHFAWVVTQVVRLATPAHASTGAAGRPATGAGSPPWRLAWRAAVPAAHGCRGNATSELWLFSRSRWANEFTRAGFELLSVRPNQLFYSGYCILGERLSVEVRRRLSSLLGSSCFVYTLRKVQ
ncbi:MAG: class I SAM-dependent methyltransferase [Deltaproteobacteria bacterium]|nr:class I SAM-dependent methyltransferase [Deltaproteobacteria bacterium]